MALHRGVSPQIYDDLWGDVTYEEVTSHHQNAQNLKPLKPKLPTTTNYSRRNRIRTQYFRFINHVRHATTLISGIILP